MHPTKRFGFGTAKTKSWFGGCDDETRIDKLGTKVSELENKLSAMANLINTVVADVDSLRDMRDTRHGDDARLPENKKEKFHPPYHAVPAGPALHFAHRDSIPIASSKAHPVRAVATIKPESELFM